MASSGISNGVSRADHQHDSWDGIDRSSMFNPVYNGVPFVNTHTHAIVVNVSTSGSVDAQINGIPIGSTGGFGPLVLILPVGANCTLSWTGCFGPTINIMAFS